MANVVVIGGQWGDEGKGKVVDLLCPAFSHVVRFNGGNNAGHTVRFADRHFALHLIPSGIVQQDCRCVVGPGVVIDPVAFAEEMRMLEQQGVSVRPRLVISPRAHLVLPGHRALDAARELARGAGKLGTTGRGIGPTYESRASRTGVRLGLARTPRRLREAVAQASGELERTLGLYPGATAPAKEEIEATIEAALALAPLLADVSAVLAEAIATKQSILFEGAQGTFLDIDHGTYPFVTSSHCLAGFAPPSCGLPARVLDGVIGVLKAYTTRVGGGPFPTELTDALGEHLRRRGNEFGTTTGRPRRPRRLDRRAARGARGGNRLWGGGGPHDAADLAAAEPVYETWPGWKAASSGVTSFEKLPAPARRYVARLEELLGAPAALISTGPRREETIVRAIKPLTRWLPELAAQAAARPKPARG